MEKKITNEVNQDSMKAIAVAKFPANVWYKFKARCAVNNTSIKNGLIEAIEKQLEKDKN